MIDLRRMRYLINRLPMARFRVDQAHARATRCTASMTGMPRPGGVGRPVERGAELIEAARAAYTQIQTELDAMRGQLRPMIEELTNALEKTAMRMRYMDGYSVREIAYRISYSEQHVFRVLQRAENAITRQNESCES